MRKVLSAQLTVKDLSGRTQFERPVGQSADCTKNRASLALWSYNGFVMRRLIAITAFAFFSLLAVPVWAQHGGGHGGGGGGHAGGGFSGHSGFSGGHSSFSGGGHAFSGEHSASGAARPFTRPSTSFSEHGFAGRNFSRPFLHDGFRGNFRTYGYGNCWGYACRGGYGYPWLAWGYPWAYYPWWWGDNDSSYDSDYQDNLAQAAEMNRQNLEEQQMLRQEEADGDQDAYARPPEPPAARGEEEHGAAMIPSTVLVFRDQHKEEIQNYAIVGHMLWSFAPGLTQKIPVADLDLDATTKANSDRGVSFRVPVPGAAQ
jgi:hypothetical protein